MQPRMSPLREDPAYVVTVLVQVVDRQTYFDAVVLDTKEFHSYDWLKKIPERWRCPEPGCIFDGIVNPY